MTAREGEKNPRASRLAHAHPRPAWNPAWQDRDDSWSSDEEGTPEISWSNTGGERESSFKKRSPDRPIWQPGPLAEGFASRHMPDVSEPSAHGDRPWISPVGAERPFRAANSSQRAAVLSALRDVRVTDKVTEYE